MLKIPFHLFQRKNENKKKKQYTIEIEGAMVKRQLQTWIKLRHEFCGHPFPSLSASVS